MVEIKFKPSLKVEKTVLIIGIILLVTIILSPIGFLFIFGSVVSMINKYFRTYTINNQNEIQDHYQFINESSQVYRIDQITSLTLSQNLFEKIFDLGSIQFGIFGKNNLYAGTQDGNNTQAAYLRQKLSTLKEYKEIFSQLNQLIGLKHEKSIYEDKPSTKPIQFWMFIWLSLFLLSIIALFFLPLEISIFLYPASFFLFAFFIIAFFINLRIRSTKYSITNNYIKYEFNYILGSKLEVVPLKKITNHEINKNIIAYSLFKVGNLKIFTGGSNDPLFDSLEEFEKFNNYLDNLLQEAKGNIKKSSNLNVKNKSNDIQNKKEVLFETKPGIGFFITFGHLLFLIFSVLTLVLIPVYLIYVIFKFLLWKNTKYKFYEDRVVDISGVINITQKEIYFKNIKHIKLEKKFLFEKLFNQGTIHIYTPGSGFVDNKISSIKEYKEVYKDLKDVIL
jgi:uncharacterized membrane protein YdbT with pleckstrin-like domain